MIQHPLHKKACEKYAQGWYIRELKQGIVRFLRRNRNQASVSNALFGPINTVDLERADADLHRDIDQTTDEFLEFQYGQGIVQGALVQIKDKANNLYFEGKLVAFHPHFMVSNPKGRWMKLLNNKQTFVNTPNLASFGKMELLPLRKNGKGFVKTPMKEVAAIDCLTISLMP